MKKTKQKHSYLDNIQADFKKHQLVWKVAIAFEKDKQRKRYLKFKYYFTLPFIWIYKNIRDWRTGVIFGIVFLIVSCEVWIPYLLGFIFWNNQAFRISAFAFGSACWLFWAGPFTPFLVICIGLTVAIKTLFDKIRLKRVSKKQK